MHEAALLALLEAAPEGERDAAVERYLGIREPDCDCLSPGEELIGYHPSGVGAIVSMLEAVPVTPSDVVVDLGSGLGKVVLLAHLLKGAKARGVDIQRELVLRAREAARALGADVCFEHQDAREAHLDDGTVFFLYVPFTGSALAHVLERLRRVAERRPIVVCALGFDLEHRAPWLIPRALESFWLTIYDSSCRSKDCAP
jgi:SAM-dependent methyltransferase